MSRESKEQRAPKIARPCTVFAVYPDNAPGSPLTWAVVTGTVDLSDIQVVETSPQGNAMMAHAYLARAVDELELLK